tara:strand:- start:9391 stop:10020 length:630 start_codon:yes stop_codon:yes gene_type:complete
MVTVKTPLTMIYNFDGNLTRLIEVLVTDPHSSGFTETEVLNKLHDSAEECYNSYVSAFGKSEGRQNRSTRTFYIHAFDCSLNLGLMSEGAFERKLQGQSICEDHFNQPQLYGKKLFNRDTPLTWDEFLRVFILCCFTVSVTSEENNSIISRDGEVSHPYINYQNLPLCRNWNGTKDRRRKQYYLSGNKPTFESFESLVQFPTYHQEYVS